MSSNKHDHIIIGAGIIGLSLARTINKANPQASILILDKEKHEAYHASSRNSGVLHAGFYYSADSLKAKFTVKGNHALRKYCEEKQLAINQCGKIVVAQNEKELKQLYELEQRGKKNGSNVRIIEESEAKTIEPNIKTFQKALHSPDTACIDPKEVCQSIRKDLTDAGVHFQFQAKYLKKKGQVIETTQGTFEGKKIINAAGLYADKIAKDFGFGQQYTIIPFKGLYLKYTKNKTDIKTNIYPVPNLKNPFLGVHFTKTVTGEIKIGPTAIPALWRENYDQWSQFRLDEMIQIGFYETLLFATNTFGFRDLAKEEIKKYNKDYFIGLAKKMVQSIDPKGFTEYTKPGIRAQLFDKSRKKLVQDFIIAADKNSVHVLNAVSPGLTCAFPFTEYIHSHFII